MSYKSALKEQPLVQMDTRVLKNLAARKAFSRPDRKRMILLAFMVSIQNGFGPSLTLTDVAHYLHVQPSTALRKMIQELQVEGYLNCRQEDYPGVAGFRRIWTLIDKSAARSATKRTVVIHHKGQRSIEMFDFGKEEK